jgi:hypothetical protein
VGVANGRIGDEAAARNSLIVTGINPGLPIMAARAKDGELEVIEELFRERLQDAASTRHLSLELTHRGQSILSDPRPQILLARLAVP